jgi:hypothetical protein
MAMAAIEISSAVRGIGVLSAGADTSSWPTRSSRDRCGCSRSGWARWRCCTPRPRRRRSNRTSLPPARETHTTAQEQATSNRRRRPNTPSHQGRRLRQSAPIGCTRTPGRDKSERVSRSRPRMRAYLPPIRHRQRRRRLRSRARCGAQVSR